MLYKMYTFFNKLFLTLQWRFWIRSHTVQEFETRMLELGCTKVHTRSSVIFTVPNGQGKIEVADDEIIVNP